MAFGGRRFRSYFLQHREVRIRVLHCVSTGVVFGSTFHHIAREHVPTGEIQMANIRALQS